jgi:fibronectin-binding autotransporter adhesin
MEDGAILNSGVPAALTLAGSTGGITYRGVGSGGVISVPALNLASAGSPGGSHLFTVADALGVDDLTISSQIADGAETPQALVKAGPGTLKLSGSNYYSGGTTILEGTLAIGASSALPSGYPISVAGGTLDLRGNSVTVGNVVTLDGGAIIGGTLTAFDYQLRSGSVSANLAGPAAVVKSGPGVVVLSGNNSFSVGTYLNEGVLAVSADANLGDAGGALIFRGGTLRGIGSGYASTARPVVWGSAGGTFDIVEQGHVFALPTQALQSAGRLTKAGLGVLRLGGNIASAEIIVQDGTLRLAGNNLFTASPTVTIHPSAALDLDGYNVAVGGLTMLGGAVKTGAGTLTLAGNVSYQRSIWPATIEGNLNLGAASRTFDVARGASTDASGFPNDLTITANISGVGGLVKTGSGTLILAGTNSFSGPTSASGGVLRFSGFGAVSGGSTITVSAGG